MIAAKNKKNRSILLSKKYLPVTIVLCSFPYVLCKEIIYSWKNDYDTPVFGKWFVVTVILKICQSTVCLFDVFFMIKFQTYEKYEFFEI